MKRYLLISIAAMLCAAASAQQAQKLKAFDHLDLTVNAGTTGVGFDLAAPIGQYVKVRAGFDVMPRFEHDMHFDIQSFDDKGNLLESKLDKMAALMKDMTGYTVDGTIDMKGKPTLWNFKLLVDIYPFRNKHWHLTTGFYWGPAKIAEAYNVTEDAPSLVAVGMYNMLYDKFAAYQRDDDGFLPDEFYSIQLFGALADQYGVATDPMVLETVYDKLTAMGRIGIRVGNYKNDVRDDNGNIVHRAGEPYRMEPDENAMVRATARVNAFKPYFGAGYEGRLIKGCDRYKIGFDAGFMLWGGTPDIITHDGTNLAKDVEDIGGKVGRYVDLISGFKVYPTLNLRITRRLF